MSELDLTKLSRPLEKYTYAACTKHQGTGYRVRAYGPTLSGESLGKNLSFKEARAIAVEFNTLIHTHKALMK